MLSVCSHLCFLKSVCITQVGKNKNTERNCVSLYVKTVLEQRIRILNRNLKFLNFITLFLGFNQTTDVIC